MQGVAALRVVDVPSETVPFAIAAHLAIFVAV
jgi:hypothetical protein